MTSETPDLCFVRTHRQKCEIVVKQNGVMVTQEVTFEQAKNMMVELSRFICRYRPADRA